MAVITTTSLGGYQGGAAQPQGGGPVQSQNWSPGAMDPMLQQLLASVLSGTQGINNLNANPGANPLFQGQINPILQAMQPFLQGQQQTLQDQQRANGNLGDTSSGISMGNLLGQQATQMGGVAANAMNQAYNNTLAGYSAPATMAGNAARSMPQYNQAYMQPQQQQGGGGNPPGTYGTGQNSFLNGQSGFNAANDPYFQNAMAQYNQNMTPNPQTQQPPPPPPPPTTPLWDILRQQSGGGGGLGGGGRESYYVDPSTGTFSNQPTSQALLGQDRYGYTKQDWANDPFYSGDGW